MAEYPAVNSTSAPEEPKEEVKSEKSIVDRITKLKDSYEQATIDSRNQFSEIYAVYMGKTDEIQSTPYNTVDDIPKLRTEIAYVKPFIFSGKPVIEIEGIGDEDKAISKIYEKMVNHRFETIPNFDDKIEAWVGQGVGGGTSEIKVVWRFKTKKNPDGSETPIQDEPDVEVPNHLDVYFDPTISEVKDQQCLIFRSVLPIKDIKENTAYDYVGEDGVRNADRVEESGQAVNQYNSSGLANVDIPASQQKVGAGKAEVFELVDDDRIQTIANGKVLRDTENTYGFKNAVKFVFEPNMIPNRYEGFGVGANTLSLDKMHFKAFNQLATTIKMRNNPMFLSKKGTIIDKRQAVGKPGGVLEVKGDGPLSDNIIPLQFGGDVESGIALLDRIEDAHKRASGANDLIQGSASNDTLGQDEIAQANTSNRFELIARRFKQSLAEVGDMILKMELQNLQSPDAEILRIFPDEMPSGQIDPMTGEPILVPGFRQQIYELLINERDNVKYNIRIKGETNVARNKNMESKRLVEMFNIATAVQTAQGPLLTNEEMRSFLRKILELNGEQNVDELIAEQGPQMQPQMQPGMEQAEMPQSMPQMPDQQVMPQ